MNRTRLDRMLVERGLAPSREKARALVLAGKVKVDGRRLDKAGSPVPTDARLEVQQPDCPFVSRGGWKLAGALSAFGLKPDGLLALDVGASTGGFTDCLLQSGAARVVALDVGRGQLDWRLRTDPRVIVVEKFNARNLEAGALEQASGGRVEASRLQLAVVDVSFISLRLILPALGSLPAPDRTICLVKPQFEVGRKQVGKGGIVRDPALHREALRTIADAARRNGWWIAGMAPSPLPGTDGNREFFLDLARGGSARPRLDGPAIAAAIQEITEVGE